MKKHLRRTLVLLLVFSLLVGVVPAVFAESPLPAATETTSGSPDPPTESTAPPETGDPPVTEPPETGEKEEPPVTEDPTQPTETEPPVTEPPVTEPAVPEPEDPAPEEIVPWELGVGDALVPYGSAAISPMTLAPGTVVTITDEVSWYVGEVYFYWYHEQYGRMPGQNYTSSGVYFHLSDGRIGFCTQAFKSSVVGDYSPSGWYDWIDTTARRGIARILTYGAPNNGDTSEEGIKATALAIWDMAAGYYTDFGVLRGHGSAPFRSHASGTILAKYDEIIAKLQRHNTIPSFATTSKYNITAAQTITLTYDSASGLYKGSAVDTNGVLADFNFVSTISGLTFSKSGNTLNVTATPAAAQQLTAGVTIKNRGHEVEVGPDSCTILASTDYGTNRQLVVILDDPIDPVPCYFKLTAENPTGSIRIIKDTNTGRDLEGWQFEIVNASTNKVVQTVTTNAQGVAVVSDLPIGQYIVREVGGGDEYWQLDTTNHTVTVSSGRTTTVTVENIQRGRIVIQKNAVNGSAKGWNFEIWKGNAWMETITTGADGVAVSSYLLPGNYTVREFHDQWMDEYWEYDVNVEQDATVVAGQDTTLTYTNTRYGKIKVIKTTNTGENLSGWQFEVRDSSGTVVETLVTDDTGSATTGKLAPGTYTVHEVGGGDEYWQLDTTGHTVTVTAGKTASVTVNNIHLGRIVVQKTAINGSAQGWNFEIWQDGSLVETLTTGADGTATSSYLLPGSYTVRELHDGDDTYWEYDVNVEQDATVTAGQDTTVTYTNTQYGRLQIVKTMADGTSPAGWEFRVTDSTGQEISGSPFTTGEDGVILSGRLSPGTYTVEEILPEYSLYFCDSENPQTVTVTAGTTAEVSFTNALRPGEISIHKVDPMGNPLSGATFLLEWSTDGVDWLPVTYTDSIQAGGCSNPDVTDGRLTTGADGLIRWEGLHPGLYYRVTEVEAPSGYLLLPDTAWEGMLPLQDGLSITLTVHNSPGYVLPEAGSNLLTWLPIVGALMMSAALLGQAWSRKKGGM